MPSFTLLQARLSIFYIRASSQYPIDLCPMSVSDTLFTIDYSARILLPPSRRPLLRVAILEQPGLRGQMSSGQNWFDSVINTTQYGGSSDEKILDLSPTVLAQQPFQSSDLGSR